MPDLTLAQAKLLDDLANAPNGLPLTLAHSRPAKTLARLQMIEIRTAEGGGRTALLLPAGEAHRHDAPADQAPLAPAPCTSAPKSSASGKLGLVLALIRRPGGATSAELMEATGWQAHSVRGAIAGSIKKKLGIPVASTSRDGVRVYSAEPAT